MAIIASYIVTCDKCGTDSGASQRTEQDATAYAVAGGWSAYPTLCPDCNARAKEAAVTNKIAGLYVSLAKALNALEEAGEAPVTDLGLVIDGISAKVVQEEDRWTVVQA